MSIRVRAAGLNPKDVIVARGKYRFVSGTRFPRGVGYDLAGEVVEGPGFTPGERVFGMIGGWMGGTCAEEVVVSAGEIARMPAGLSFVEGAAIPLAAQTALQALRGVEGRVLIHGASGGVGTFAIQLARVAGCEVVTTSSAGNLELCRELGAHLAIDRGQQSGTAAGPFDAIFDVFGDLRWPDVRRALRPRGRYVTTFVARHRLAAHLLSPRRCGLVRVRSRRADLDHLARLVEAGQLRAVIDRVVPLEAIADGLERVQSKRTRGKVVVAITSDPT